MASVDIKVTGADRLARLGVAIKDAGDKDLRRELMRGMQRAAKPLKTAARTAALQHLPRHGGLNVRVAQSKFSARTSVAGRNPGLRIVGAGDLDLPALDRGRLRHPVFGNRRTWVNQQIPAGWFTNAMNAHAPAVRAELIKAIETVATKLEGKA